MVSCAHQVDWCSDEHQRSPPLFHILSHDATANKEGRGKRHYMEKRQLAREKFQTPKIGTIQNVHSVRCHFIAKRGHKLPIINRLCEN